MYENAICENSKTKTRSMMYPMQAKLSHTFEIKPVLTRTSRLEFKTSSVISRAATMSPNDSKAMSLKHTGKAKTQLKWRTRRAPTTRQRLASAASVSSLDLPGVGTPGTRVFPDQKACLAGQPRLPPSSRPPAGPYLLTKQHPLSRTRAPDGAARLLPTAYVISHKAL